MATLIFSHNFVNNLTFPQQHLQDRPYLAPTLVGIKQENVLFISEPQDDFFCFIPLSLDAKSVDPIALIVSKNFETIRMTGTIGSFHMIVSIASKTRAVRGRQRSL